MEKTNNESNTKYLSDIERAEIKKAFFMVDRDGNGSIDAKELRTVVRAVLEEDPKEEDLQELFKLMDTDQSGTIEFEEFMTALSSWMKDYKVKPEENPMERKRRRADSEREDLHKKIKGFFSQFQKNSTVDQIRRKIEFKRCDSASNPLEIERYGSSQKVDPTAQQKLEALNFCKNAINNLSALSESLKSENTYQQIESTAHLVKMLSIVEVFPSSQERRVVAEVIVKIYEFIVQHSITRVLVKFLTAQNSPPLQFAALRAITLVAPGPRIAGCPSDSLLNPEQMFFKKLVISEGGVPIIINLLGSLVDDIKEQAVVALGAISAHNHECRDFILRHNVLAPLCKLLLPTSKVTLLRKLAWTLATFCGVTHIHNQLPPFELIAPGLPTLAQLLFREPPDEEVVVSVCGALAVILPGVNEPNICKRLVDLLFLDNCPNLQVSVLETLANVIQFGETQTNILLQFNLLTTLRNLLKSPHPRVRLLTCEVLIQIVRVRSRISLVIAAHIPQTFNTLVSIDDQIRFKLAKVMKYISKGSHEHIGLLVSLGCVKTLCSALSYFKVYDPILTSVYKFYGPSFNFDFIRDIIGTLFNIIKSGDEIADERRIPNPYATHFDMDGVDKIGALLTTIRESSPADYQKGESAYKRLDTKVQDLLVQIKRAHDLNANARTSRHISEMIAGIWKRFNKEDITDNRKISLKCFLDDDLRLLDVPQSILIAQLLAELSIKYGKPLDGFSLTYKDDEGDYITIDSQDTFKKLVATSINKNKVIKVFLKKAKDTSPAGVDFTKVGVQQPSPPPLPSPSSEADTPSTQIPSFFNPINPDKVSFASDLEALKKDKSAIFQHLSSTTHFKREEIEQLNAQWEKHAVNGCIGKKEFANGLKSLGIDDLMIDQNFAAFDVNKDGNVNFREFVSGLSVVLRGTFEERLQLMFRLYDGDGSGFLTKDEVREIFLASLTSKGKPVNLNEVVSMVNDIFTQLDENGDGKLSFAEFKKGVEQNKLIVNCFVHFPQPNS